jgi:hypothetical protein
VHKLGEAAHHRLCDRERVGRAGKRQGVGSAGTHVGVRGGVWINDHIPLVSEMPPGGSKDSG